MSEVISIEVELSVLYCANCGVSFAIPTTMFNRRVKDAQTFYCPNGHTNFFMPEKKVREKARVLTLPFFSNTNE